MGLERKWIWTCDDEGCTSSVATTLNGFPKGWAWVKSKEAGGESGHRCPTHATPEQIKEMQKWHSKTGFAQTVIDVD